MSDCIKIEFNGVDIGKDSYVGDFTEFCSSIDCKLTPQQEEIARLILGRDKVALNLSMNFGKNYMRDLIMKFEESL